MRKEYISSHFYATLYDEFACVATPMELCEFSRIDRYSYYMADRTLTPLGHLLEEHRAALGLSGREAARRAGISESRWRQVVSGVQPTSGKTVPVNPRPRTVVAMAQAVHASPRDALEAAGLDPARLEAMLSDTSHTAKPGFDVAEEIGRVTRLRIPADTRLLLIRRILDLHEEATRESGAGSEK